MSVAGDGPQRPRCCSDEVNIDSVHWVMSRNDESDEQMLEGQID